MATAESTFATNERGYILIESLIGLVLLSTVITVLLQVLPVLHEAKQILNTEQKLYNLLYEIRDQQFYLSEITIPIPAHIPVDYRLFHRNHEVCAIYQWRNRYEKTLCL